MPPCRVRIGQVGRRGSLCFENGVWGLDVDYDAGELDNQLNFSMKSCVEHAHLP